MTSHKKLNCINQCCQKKKYIGWSKNRLPAWRNEYWQYLLICYENLFQPISLGSTDKLYRIIIFTTCDSYYSQTWTPRQGLSKRQTLRREFVFSIIEHYYTDWVGVGCSGVQGGGTLLQRIIFNLVFIFCWRSQHGSVLSNYIWNIIRV